MSQNVRKKKIVFLLNDMDLGGVQKSMIAMLKYLTSLQRFEIDLIIWQKGGILEKEIPPSVKVIYKYYAPTLKDIEREKILIRKIKYLFQFIRFKWYASVRKKPWEYFNRIQKQYDIAVSYVHIGHPLCFTIDKIKASKKILWFHYGLYEATDRQKLLDEIYYDLYNVIVAVSDSNKEEIIRNFPLLKTELRVISNLIEIEVIWQKSKDCITDLPSNPNGYNFVTVSRISQVKGIDLALDVAYQLKNKGVKFKWYFIGGGELYEEKTKYIIDKKISDVCVLLGGKINPYPYIHLADIYVQPSYVESQCLTVYEALALKKLIVATDIPALNEALQDGKLGVLCEPNSNVMTDTIDQLISDHAHRERLHAALEKHNVSNIIIYEKINDLFKI